MRRLLLVVAALVGTFPLQALAQDADVAVLARSVARGEQLGSTDFATESRPASASRGALSADEAVGMEAARNLREGMTVRRSDLRAPQLVRRGEPVTIRVVRGPMLITTTGRALADGAEGDLVRVVTNTTNRTLDGLVDGSGSVRIAVP